jgi:hypothetical protein
MLQNKNREQVLLSTVQIRRTYKHLIPYTVTFSLLQVVQTGSGVRPTSYPMAAGGYFPWGKATGA